MTITNMMSDHETEYNKLLTDANAVSQEAAARQEAERREAKRREAERREAVRQEAARAANTRENVPPPLRPRPSPPIYTPPTDEQIIESKAREDAKKAREATIEKAANEASDAEIILKEEMEKIQERRKERASQERASQERARQKALDINIIRAKIINNNTYNWNDISDIIYTNQPIENDNFVNKVYLDEEKTIDHLDVDGYTLLSRAILANNIKMIQFLINNRANINQLNGNSPLLDSIISSRSTNIMELLLKNGANVNLHALNSSTPLIIAVKMEDIDKIKLLLDYGADVEYTNNYGETALSIAKNNKLDTIIELLMKKNN